MPDLPGITKTNVAFFPDLYFDMKELPSVSRLVSESDRQRERAGEGEGESSLPSNLSWSSTETPSIPQESSQPPPTFRRLSPRVLFTLQSPLRSENLGGLTVLDCQ